MGAYGAALYGKKVQKEKSKLLNLEELENFQHVSSPGMCKLCTNHCQLTINAFTNGQKFISGNNVREVLERNYKVIYLIW